MARKKLLTEGEIRQFMKLANLRPITNVRLSEMGGAPPYPGARDPEEEEDDEMAMGDDEMAMGDDEMAMGDDEMAMGDDEMGLGDEEMDLGDEAGAGDPEKEQMLADVVMAVADALGISDQVDIEGAEGGEEVAVEDEFEVEEPLPGGGEEELGMEVEDEEEELVAEIVRRLREKKKDWGHGKGEYKRSKNPKTGRESKTGEGPKGHFKDYEKKDESMRPEDQIVNEVAKRVALRLQRQTRKEQMADHLAERIMKRLTK